VFPGLRVGLFAANSAVPARFLLQLVWLMRASVRPRQPGNIGQLAYTAPARE